MLTITGTGRLTHGPQLRHTRGGKAVVDLQVACDRRGRGEDAPAFVEVVLWERGAQAAAEHLVRGQSISFRGRPEVRAYLAGDGEPRAVLQVVSADIEYGAKPRATHRQAAGLDAPRQDVDDIPF